MEIKMRVFHLNCLLISIFLLSTGCKSGSRSVIDAVKVKPPGPEFHLSEPPISDHTFGQFVFTADAGSRVEVYVFPNPPVTDDTRNALRSVQESYSKIMKSNPKNASSFRVSGSTVNAFWTAKTMSSNQGELNSIYYLKDKIVQIIVSNTESLAKGVKASNQAFESNLGAFSTDR